MGKGPLIGWAMRPAAELSGVRDYPRPFLFLPCGSVLMDPDVGGFATSTSGPVPGKPARRAGTIFERYAIGGLPWGRSVIDLVFDRRQPGNF